MSAKTTTITIVTILILILIGGGILFFTTKTQTTQNVFETDKDTKKECLDRRADLLSDIDNFNCLPCSQWTEEQFNCVVNNNEIFVLDPVIDERDREDIIDDRKWTTVCYRDYDIDTTNSRFEPEAWIVLRCLEDDEYDYNDFCSKDSECSTEPTCEFFNRLIPKCINNVCSYEIEECTYGCEDGECKQKPSDNGGGDDGNGDDNGGDHQPEPPEPKPTPNYITYIALSIIAIFIIGGIILFIRKK